MKISIHFEFDSIEEAVAAGYMAPAIGGSIKQPAGEKKQSPKKEEKKIDGKPTVGVTIPMDTTIDFTGGGETTDFPELASTGSAATVGDDLDSFLGGGGSPLIEKKPITREELRQKASTIASKNDDLKKKVIALIKKSGVTDLTQLPDTAFVAFDAELDKLK